MNVNEYKLEYLSIMFMSRCMDQQLDVKEVEIFSLSNLNEIFKSVHIYTMHFHVVIV
jgi:hypothetical protein